MFQHSKMQRAMFFLALCFSAEAAMTHQKLRTNVRGSMKTAVHGDPPDLEEKPSSENKEDPDENWLEDLAADVETLKNKLAANSREQAKLESSLDDLPDQATSDRQIDTSAELVANETESPAMGHMLGKMWKDLRRFETPAYTEHVEDEIKELKKEQKALEVKLKAATDQSTAVAPHGSEDCRCIGIDEIEGETVIALKNHGNVSYPAEVGSHCEAWDAEVHPGCPGESWCAQEWCYVDPCKCKNVAALPKPSTYLPDAKYQGKPVHFSYSTCGATDSYSAKQEKKTAKHIKKTCAVHVDSSTWGAKNCRCVGMGPQNGTTKVAIKGKKVAFPADVGSTCNAWEDENHPDCDSADPPAWCSQSWCYVDPCSCDMETPPKTSNYMPDANYQGKPVYYSYATCGGSDSWSTGRKDACVNQKTSGSCGKLDKCAWTGKVCLGKELVEVCDLQPSPNANKRFEAKAAAKTSAGIMAGVIPLVGIAYFYYFYVR